MEATRHHDDVVPLLLCLESLLTVVVFMLANCAGANQGGSNVRKMPAITAVCLASTRFSAKILVRFKHVHRTEDICGMYSVAYTLRLLWLVSLV